MNRETKHTFLSYDGTKLEGTLMIPDSHVQQIALLVHGITSSRDELGLFSGLAKHLSESGIASFRFDYRCHGVNKQPMAMLTLAGIVNDIEAAYIYVNELVRPTYICPIGMSFGGGLTAYWAATTCANVKSVVLLAPVIDYQQDILGQHGLMDGEKLSTSASSLLLKNEFIETDGISYGAALVNELPHINGIVGLQKLKCRLLILHGDTDSVVPYSLSMKFASLNSRCELVNIPGTDHGFGIPGDEDLTSPETKQQHTKVFEIILQFLMA